MGSSAVSNLDNYWEKWYSKNKDSYLEKRKENMSKKYHENKNTKDFRLNILLKAAKRNAKNKDVQFDIDIEYLQNLWDTQSGSCLLSKRKFDLEPPSGTFTNYNAPSLDRIIPSKGYTKGNVRLIIWGLNLAINEFGLDEFIKLSKEVLNNYEE